MTPSLSRLGAYSEPDQRLVIVHRGLLVGAFVLGVAAFWLGVTRDLPEGDVRRPMFLALGAATAVVGAVVLGARRRVVIDKAQGTWEHDMRLYGSSRRAQGLLTELSAIELFARKQRHDLYLKTVDGRRLAAVWKLRDGLRLGGELALWIGCGVELTGFGQDRNVPAPEVAAFLAGLGAGGR